jgi:hypothetical protein
MVNKNRVKESTRLEHFFPHGTPAIDNSLGGLEAHLIEHANRFDCGDFIAQRKFAVNRLDNAAKPTQRLNLSRGKRLRWGGDRTHRIIANTGDGLDFPRTGNRDARVTRKIKLRSDCLASLCEGDCDFHETESSETGGKVKSFLKVS